ncbi:MarR family winged helix-turn-helix transcriptional regulator [Brachymonas chironomi]|uniref:MarR family winged helix-turn-helix transcriptional regulator n=1 Tax=Brachymonas chironomi TaxID=491919 RepID=UPI00036D966D|nr:MarR family winged helix-turn-helix transcriptional regulator [Brachymonas chironomi]
MPFSLDRSFTHRLHTLSKITDRQTQQAYQEAAGLPLGEGRCLAAIGSFSPLSLNEVAHMANVNKGQASRAVQSLVDQGLVDKQVNAADARGVELTLTEKGQASWQHLMQVIALRNEDIVACLDDVQRAQLDALLDVLVQHARASD